MSRILYQHCLCGHGPMYFVCVVVVSKNCSVLGGERNICGILMREQQLYNSEPVEQSILQAFVSMWNSQCNRWVKVWKWVDNLIQSLTVLIVCWFETDSCCYWERITIWWLHGDLWEMNRWLQVRCPQCKTQQCNWAHADSLDEAVKDWVEINYLLTPTCYPEMSHDGEQCVGSLHSCSLCCSCSVNEDLALQDWQSSIFHKYDIH